VDVKQGVDMGVEKDVILNQAVSIWRCDALDAGGLVAFPVVQRFFAQLTTSTSIDSRTRWNVDADDIQVRL